jgi:penicillin amidase
MQARLLTRAALLVTLMATSCHPNACWFPPEFPVGEPTFTLTSNNADFPIASVDVLLDDEGVPHIFGDNDVDLAYALGFMHGRDRQFQMYSFRLALFGRLAELQGEGEVDSDKAARLITYAVDEQVANLSGREHDLLEAYAAGANDGAAFAGPSMEMVFTGGVWEPWAPRDSIAIVRFFAWDLSTVGMYGELARVTIANRLDEDDPRRAELMQSVWTGGTPVVRGDEHSGLTGFDYPWAGEELPIAPRPQMPAHLSRKVAKDHPAAGKRPTEARPSWLNRMQGAFRLPLASGASNVWAVHGSAMSNGVPAHAHDPHLAHRTPGLFYLAHLESEGMLAAGASVPGAPGILLGHGRHVAWGTPVSNADSVDMVRITPVEGREDEAYWLDGEEVAFERLEQVYKLGFDDNAETVTETWLITEFGPVLPPAWQYLHDEGEMYAMMWPGHRPIEGSGEIVTSLWDLAKSNNLEEAEAAIQKLTSPAITMGMAFDDGTIAYRISGDLPVRRSAEPPWLPRDGTRRQARWAGRLPKEYKPQLTNPARNYYVAANQRIVGQGGPSWEVVGIEGDHPFRAMRITELLDEGLADGEMTPDEVFAIQQDSTSVFARETAPIYGEHCPDDIDGFERWQVTAFCDAIRSFDGFYSTDSTGAVPYRRLDEAFRTEVLKEPLGEEVAFRLRNMAMIQTTIFRALLATAEGDEPAIFDLPETVQWDGPGVFMARATKVAMELMVADGLDFNSDNWTWGDFHYREPKGVLRAIPAIGGSWVSERRPEMGCWRCPRAERGKEAQSSPEDIGDAREGRTPTHEIQGGAVLRIHSIMSDPPVVKVVNDLGQSGAFGHPTSEIAYDRWQNNDPAQLAVSREDVESRESGRVTLVPAAGGE